VVVVDGAVSSGLSEGVEAGATGGDTGLDAGAGEPGVTGPFGCPVVTGTDLPPLAGWETFVLRAGAVRLRAARAGRRGRA
jgi:hypothetical protein